MSTLKLALLGIPQVVHAEAAVAFPTRKALGLLAYLATEGGLHSRDKLIALLWPESDDASSRATLRSTLARLREALANDAIKHLKTQRDLVGIDASAGLELDLHVIQAASNLSSTSEQLVMAAALCRGEFLEGFGLRDATEFDDWLAAQRQVWNGRMARILDRLSEAQMDRGQVRDAIATTSQWLTFEPLDETAYRRSMQLFAILGDRSAALRAFEACRSRLERELGVAPAPETQALAERIRTRLDAPSAPPIAAVTVTLETAGVAPLVGRELEVARLSAAYRLARQGRCHVVLLQGEAGIGKTRLADEFLAWASMQGADVLRGRAFEAGGRLPFQPLVDTLRPRLERENAPEDLLSDVWLAELGRLLPELRDRYPDLPPPAGDDAAARARLYEAIARLGQAFAERAPLVLFVDDIQWADTASLDVLRYATGRWAQTQANVLVLLAVRAEALAVTPQLSEWLTGLGRDIQVIRLDLQALPAEDTFLFVRLLGVQEPRFATWLHEETGGEPFFLVEMVKALLERGVLTAESTNAQEARLTLVAPMAADFWRGLLPPGVRDVVRARLSWLSPAAQTLLTAGAVLGQAVSLVRIARVANLSDDAALLALEECMRSRLLREETQADQARYLFAHDKIRQVAYADISHARQQLLHRRALEVLQEAGARPAELAQHAEAAGLLERALDLNVAAGDEARMLLAASDAAARYQAAMILAQRLGRADIVPELHARCGQALASITAWSDARRELESSLSGLTAERRAEVLVELAMACHWLLDVPSTRRYAAEALHLAEELQRDDLAAGAIGAFAFADSSDGELAASLEGYNAAFVRAGDRPVALLAPAAEMSALILYWRGRYEESVSAGESAVSLAQGVHDPSNVVRALGDLGMAQGASDRFVEAFSTFKEARRFGQEYGLITWTARAVAMYGGLCLDVGDFEAAETLAEEARDLARSVNFVHPVISAGIDLMLNFVRRGEIDRAEHLVDEVAHAARSGAGAHGWLWRLRLAEAMAELQCARGAWEPALIQAEEALARAARHDRPKYRVLGLTARAQALLSLGRAREAIADLHRAVDLARQLGSGPLFVACGTKLLGLDGEAALDAEVVATTQRIMLALPSRNHQVLFHAYISRAARAP
jgi:DNA-binding SARP family transcriptional activator/tetratricopeptide (TPR) repeat protein